MWTVEKLIISSMFYVFLSVTLQKWAKPSKIIFYLVNFPRIIFEIFFLISKGIVMFSLLILVFLYTETDNLCSR